MLHRTNTRSRTSRRWAIAALVATTAVSLAACGGSGSGAGTSGVSGATGSSSVEAFSRLDIMAPAAPGGGWDSTARAMAQSIEAADLAKSVTVKNVTGAGGTVGLAQLANDKSDSSLMVMGLVMVGAVATNQSPASLKDVTPIARLTAEDEVLVVPASSPYKTLDDLVADLKAKGRGVTITGGSAGGTDHMVAGLLAKAAGVPPADLNYIPFSGGGESLAALLGNKVSAGISGVSEYSEQIKAGKLRPLAVAGPERVNGVDAPTMKEAGYDVELINWRGVVAPGGLSADETQRLVDTVTAMHNTPAWKDALKTNGWDDVFLAGEAFKTYITKEIATTDAVLKDLGLVK